MKKTISIVIPLYNEEGNVDELCRQLNQLFREEKKYNFEVITVEHGSTDATFSKLLKIRKKNKNFKILQLSRNFGNVDAAISAGLKFSKGNAAVILMGDLQEPPALISKFLRKWEQGYGIVYGIIKKRADISLIRKINSLLFYKLLSLFTGNILPKNASDYRLIDKKVYETINKMEERNKYLKGLTFWTGFKQIGISYNRSQRFSGDSKADFLTVLKVATNGILSFSYVPLRLVTILGFVVAIISFSTLVLELILFLVFGREAQGVLTIVVLISFLFGMTFIILGVIGEYIVRIYDEVKKRPTFIINKKIGL
ncbi:MAG: Glycosyl transferase family 2 [Candidatus Curtissbacteria bacterium GW2011_GWA1_41_11]|uniref:Glycosyl transferase family 2 n=1 Tax=Candidatus Curtissbacteria bacterium GW2011_GWA1_41_11 TaxID=1618409 RepID=A0A0G0UH65_9BACT|nr:MAG: Glycosyl transferase family 2 [Candidatus Curtissbacteria bacterium GW2011_GWA1_41_11]